MQHMPNIAKCLTIAILLSLIPWCQAMAQFGGGDPPIEGGSAPFGGRISPTTNPSLTTPDTGSREYQQIETMQRRVQAARFGLQVVDRPLDEVVEIITQKTGIPMRIDNRALEDVGLSVDTPITFNLPEVAADTLLYLMLKELDLVYIMDTGSVVITTPEVEESDLRTKFYPVEDIFNDPNPNYDFMIQLLTICLEPESWEELGGPGSIAPLRNGLIIAQTYQNHRRIEGLFRTLRRVQKSATQDDLPMMMSIAPYAQEAERIEKRLREVRTTITLADAPLEKAVAAISNFGNIPMIIDNRALEDVGLSTDTPLTMQINDATLAYMLQVLGEKLDLTTVIFGEVVIVTTPEEAESELATLVYPVKDLVRYHPQTHQELTKRQVTQQFDKLTEAITTTIEPESWEELGGPGSQASFPYADCLVISQTDEVHRKVAELLEQVRRAKPKVTVPIATPPPTTNRVMSMPSVRPAAAPQPTVQEDIIVVSYGPAKEHAGEFTREKFARIAQQVRQVVAPQSWSGEEYFAEATHSGVFVRQSRDVQRTVASYLASQGLIAPPIDEDPAPAATTPDPPVPEVTPEIPSPSEGQSNFDSSAGGGGLF